MKNKLQVFDIPQDLRMLTRDLMSLAGKAVNNRKIRRDMLRIRTKFEKEGAVKLRDKDLTKVLYMINIELKLIESLFASMSLQEEKQLENASKIHQDLYRVKEIFVKPVTQGVING